MFLSHLIIALLTSVTCAMAMQRKVEWRFPTKMIDYLINCNLL